MPLGSFFPASYTGIAVSAIVVCAGVSLTCAEISLASLVCLLRAVEPDEKEYKSKAAQKSALVLECRDSRLIFTIVSGLTLKSIPRSENAHIINLADLSG